MFNDNEKTKVLSIVLFAFATASCGGDFVTTEEGGGKWVSTSGQDGNAANAGWVFAPGSDLTGDTNTEGPFGHESSLLFEPTRIPSDQLEMRRQPQVLRACAGGRLEVVRSNSLACMTKDAYTLETWVRLEQASDRVLLRGDGVTLEVHRGRFRATVDEKAMVGLNAVSHEWYHLALAKQGRKARFFVNGIPLGEQRVRARQSLTDGFVLGNLGQEATGCVLFEALRVVGEAIYTSHFTPFQQLRPNDNMAAGYDFDTRNGKVIPDQSPNGNDARLSGQIELVKGKI